MATPWFVLEQFNTQGIFITQRTSKVEFLCKISEWLLAVNYFREKNFIVETRLCSKHASVTV